jgi:hypothetical protein
MERSIKTKQRKLRMLSFTVNAAGTAITGPDQKQVSVADTGTGVKTVTLNDAFADTEYVVQVTVGTADAIANVEISSSSSFVVDTLDATDGTTAKDAITHITVIGSDITDKY